MDDDDDDDNDGGFGCDSVSTYLIGISFTELGALTETTDDLGRER